MTFTEQTHIEKEPIILLRNANILTAEIGREIKRHQFWSLRRFFRYMFLPLGLVEAVSGNFADEVADWKLQDLGFGEGG